MRSTFSVVGSYWMSCISSFWKITLPGVVAMLTPTARLVGSDWRMRKLPLPASISSASIFMPRTRLSPLEASVSRSTSGLVRTKFDGAIALVIWLNVELGLLARVRVEAFGVVHEVLRPLRRQQIELHHEIEELVRFPLRIGESLVARRGRNRRRRFFAGQAAHRRAPEIEIALGDLGLQVGRAVVVGEPIFGDRGEGLDHFGEFGRRLVLDLAALARLQIGRKRLAAAFHRARDIHREGFSVELLGGLGFDRHVGHGEHRVSCRGGFVTALDRHWRWRKLTLYVERAALRQNTFVLSHSQLTVQISCSGLNRFGREWL